jgi:hypothetical protein
MRDDCQAQFFGLVVQLSCNKILGKLGFNALRTSCWLGGHCLHASDNCIATMYKLPSQVGATGVLTDSTVRSEALKQLFRRLEEGKPEELIPNVKRHLAVCSQRFRGLFANAEWYPLVPSIPRCLHAQDTAHARHSLTA